MGCDKINNDEISALVGTARVMRELGREARKEARSEDSDYNSVTGWRDAGMDRKTDRPGHNCLCKCEDLSTELTGLGTQMYCVKEMLGQREFRLSNSRRESGLP